MRVGCVTVFGLDSVAMSHDAADLRALERALLLIDCSVGDLVRLARAKTHLADQDLFGTELRRPSVVHEEIFEKYLELGSARSLSRHLQRRGITTPSGKDFDAEGS
jgi:hypothetical protein